MGHIEIKCSPRHQSNRKKETNQINKLTKNRYSKHKFPLKTARRS